MLVIPSPDDIQGGSILQTHVGSQRATISVHHESRTQEFDTEGTTGDHKSPFLLVKIVVEYHLSIPKQLQVEKLLKSSVWTKNNDLR